MLFMLYGLMDVVVDNDEDDGVIFVDIGWF
jgi:hypothetical protein